jgi:hypothetical protein
LSSHQEAQTRSLLHAINSQKANIYSQLKLMFHVSLIINYYRISDLHFNVTPPPVPPSSTLNEKLTSNNTCKASERQHTILIRTDDDDDDADDGNSANAGKHKSPKISCESLQVGDKCERQRNNDVVIEEVPVECDQGASSFAEKSEKSLRIEKIASQEAISDSFTPPLSASSLPASISTQTLPTEEFPEASISSAFMRHSIDKDKSVDADTRSAETMLRDISDVSLKHAVKRTKSRSIEECRERQHVLSEVDSTTVELRHESSLDSKLSCDDAQLLSCEQRQLDENLLTHQTSQVSQDEDYEIAMVSGLLPGCVGEC